MRDTNIEFPIASYSRSEYHPYECHPVENSPLERKQQIIGRGVDVNCARRALVILGEKEIAGERGREWMQAKIGRDRKRWKYSGERAYASVYVDAPHIIPTMPLQSSLRLGDHP